MFFDSLLPTPPLQFTLVLYLQDRNKSKWQIFDGGFENESVPYTILTVLQNLKKNHIQFGEDSMICLKWLLINIFHDALRSVKRIKKKFTYFK